MFFVARLFNFLKYKFKIFIFKCSYINREFCVVNFGYKIFFRIFLIVFCIKYIKILY